jgi:hypothetical protein
VRFECTDDQAAQWRIPAGWIVRELTPVEASLEVARATLVQESADARWEALRSTWREGDTYWLYRRNPSDTINALGARQGVVLIRGCEQLGFVTTRIESETKAPRR